MKRKICVFTGTRAEYGILRSLMYEIKKDKDLKLQIIVSGMHLSPEFALTYKEIEKDGFSIDAKIEILLSSDTSTGLNKSIGLGLISFSEAYERMKPDIVIILGDRCEAFAAATAAMISKIPIGHIGGGDSTFGAIDENIRHAITKMSHLHFTIIEEHKKRIIQLGENSKRVFNVGAMGLDTIKRSKLLSKKEVERKLNFKFNKYNLMVTFHPATLEKSASVEQFQNLLAVLDELKDTNIIFTKANADPDGRKINSMIDSYVSNNCHKSIAFISMGQLIYLSTMQFVDGLVGNSSSGIIEAVSFKIGTVNIGTRQEGRVKAESIIDCGTAKESIQAAVKRLYSGEFQKILKKVNNPYGDGNAAKKIKGIIKKYNLDGILKKRFHDISL